MNNENEDFEVDSQSGAVQSTSVSRTAIAAIAGVAVVLVLIALDVALVGGAQATPPRPVVQVVKLSASGTEPVQPVVYLTVSPELKPGADGKLHDAFSVTDYTVHAGQPVQLVINNTDGAPHSITSPAAGVNILVRPGIHTYTLVVHKTGRFEWFCAQPCDPYSMSHVGYMRGYITSI